MPVEILMPELGESVFEGTITRWLKKVGDVVKEDEPVVEIMTDKVNTELGAPAAGTLSQILVQEGDTVKVLSPMGLIETGSSAANAPASEVAKDAPSEPSANVPVSAPGTAEVTVGEDERRWVTPVVRAMVKEHGLTDEDLKAITGSGEGGRVTKKDVEAYLSAGKPTRVATVTSEVISSVPPTPIAPTPVPVPKPAPQPTVAGPEQELVPLVGMRKMIAEAMIRSSHVPTVSTVTQVDVTTMVKFRELNKESFQTTYGVKLTYTPFFIKALAETLAEFPLVNASLRDDNQIVMNKGIHIGIAVALGKGGDQGLIVPVIRNCHSKTLVEIARDLDEIAKKARANKLGVEDVKGGTFTLTNPGTYGALFGTPMINAPQGGILGAYAISKQPVIIDDMIAIRSIMHLVLTYDHRLVDGMLAGKFLAGVRDRLQSFDFFR
jgi:pyruvate/2-oxoglutarate dehydrogenase complex dihydrolipoamide acyltransferase (E2) component